MYEIISIKIRWVPQNKAKVLQPYRSSVTEVANYLLAWWDYRLLLPLTLCRLIALPPDLLHKDLLIGVLKFDTEEPPRILDMLQQLNPPYGP